MKLKLGNEAGFTLTELLVAIALSSFVGVAIFMSFTANLRAFNKQEQTVEIQQNVRAAMDIMVRDIRMACYNPVRSVVGLFGPAQMDVSPDPDNGWGALEIHFNRTIADSVRGDDETVRYSLIDDPNISPMGVNDLARQENSDDGGVEVPLVGFVEGLAFAFAFDADGDGLVDRDAANNNIVWAIDTDGDGDLDSAVDTNSDGIIDQADDNASQNSVALNTVLPGVATAGPETVRGARIWLLVRAEQQERMLDNRTYVVGNQRVTPAGNGRSFQRRMLTETVWMRNCGLGGT